MSVSPAIRGGTCRFRERRRCRGCARPAPPMTARSNASGSITDLMATPSAAGSSDAVKLRDCLVGANPIIWSNDDFDELAGDVPLDVILSEMRLAGYAGSELGHAYPRTAPELGA